MFRKSDSHIQFQTAVSVLKHLADEWKGRPDHKTARLSVLNTLRQIQMEYETGQIPSLPRKQSWLERIESSRIVGFFSFSGTCAAIFIFFAFLQAL